MTIYILRIRIIPFGYSRDLQ